MKTKLWFLIFVPVVAVAALLFQALGGGQTGDVIRVDLTDKAEVAPVQQVRGCSFSHHSSDLLRVGISGVLSPSRTLEDYRELLTFMGHKLDRQVSMILKPTYAETNALLEGKYVDLGIICSLAYVQGNEDFGLELLVVPQINGVTVYYSYLIVSRDSSAGSLEDLRGASFAFADPLSNSGYLAPTYQLSMLNEAPFSFFSRYIFTYSHDNSIYSVADKLVDGAAVDSLVYEQLVAKYPEVATKTRVIARWGPYGMPPMVVNPALDPQLKQQLRDFFLDLHNSAEGQRILRNLGIDKFVVIPDSSYDSIREMKKALGR